MIKTPVFLIPEYRDYIWGGARLRPEIVPTAEAWIVHGENRVAAGPYAGRSLNDLAAEYGAELLGQRTLQNSGLRFPLLVKLLDCAQWLSVQVHPNDAQAVQMEGPGFSGKTEAWHILEAEPGARLLAGIKAGVSAGALAASIQDGSVVEQTQSHLVRVGETFFMPAGTIHALGPGMLIYEIQQASDLTYRVYDWDRPQTGGRKLHIEQALAVSRPEAAVSALPAPTIADGETRLLVECDYFKLELLAAKEQAIACHTRGETFHALTAIQGQAQITAGAENLLLKRFETLLIPAACGEYRIAAVGECRLLRAGI